MNSKKNFLILILGITGCVSTFAQNTQYQRPEKNIVNKQEPSTPKADKEEYKVDISDIEKKYWAPKDTDFSVVQSRTYNKANRFSLSLQGGLPINDTFNKGNFFGLSSNYFFNERHGLGLSYISAKLGNTKAIDNFRYQVGGGAAGTEPDRGRLSYYYGINYVWVPIYAKMSLLGQKILYFDMAISPSIGISNYDKLSDVKNISETAFTYGLDITQYYFLNKNWAIRADLKNNWYSEKRVTFKTGDPISTQTNTTTMFMMGFIYYH
jgi:outer membrane beta-barrel protein